MLKEKKTEFRRYEIKLSSNGGYKFEAGNIFRHYDYVGGHYYKWIKDEDIIKKIHKLYQYLTANGIEMKIERVK